MRLLPAATLVPAFALALALGACATSPQSGVNPYPPVPVARMEPIPRPPVTGTPLLWQPGRYDWTGGGYAWTPGTYVARAGLSGRWQPGYWQRGPSLRWSWVPAHWAA